MTAAATATDVLEGRAHWSVQQSDAIAFMDGLPEKSVSLVMGSPPYLNARTYGVAAQRDCALWVDWMLAVTTSAIRVSAGLVCWVVAGTCEDRCYQPGPEGLVWEWWRRGNQLWRPCIWFKNEGDFDAPPGVGGTGTPGSGGKQMLRNDWEFILLFKRDREWLPWADNVACGHIPHYSQAGGPMSNRDADGIRADDRRRKADDNDPWNMGRRGAGYSGRYADGQKKKGNGSPRKMTQPNGSKEEQSYVPPKLANPGNVIKARVGGGHMGSRLAHESEAPYAEKVPETFVRSYCPSDGIVLDPFTGSGTTGVVSLRWGRKFVGCDLRGDDQPPARNMVALARRRIAAETPALPGLIVTDDQGKSVDGDGEA
jgi:hypothetical protein